MRESIYRAIANKRWRKTAEWITGNGRYALLARCRALTITLHSTLEKACESKKIIDDTGCGGMCVGNHEILDLGELKNEPPAPSRDERGRG